MKIKVTDPSLQRVLDGHIAMLRTNMKTSLFCLLAMVSVSSYQCWVAWHAVAEGGMLTAVVNIAFALALTALELQLCRHIWVMRGVMLAWKHQYEPCLTKDTDA